MAKKKLSSEAWIDAHDELTKAAEALDFKLVEELWKKYEPLAKESPLLGSPEGGWLLETARNAMQQAHDAGDLKAVKQLLTKYPALGKENWLELAVVSGHPKLVELWLDRAGPKPKGLADSFKHSLLQAPNAEMARFLISRGAKVTCKDRYGGFTPLHHARTAEVVRVLLEAGADPSATDECGKTALDVMRSLKRRECVEALLAVGAPAGQPPKPARKSSGQITGTVVIDIRDDMPDFLAYLRKRVADHVKAAAKRKDPPPVRMIDFGFEFGQANWVALAFDTREDAEPDGEWSLDVEKFLMKRPKWPIWHKLADDAHVYFINIAGDKIDVMPDPDNLICNVVGDALKATLLAARDQHLFDPLPRAERCELGVENLEGFYGWPIYEDRGKENLV